jgi:hypothetical protein
MKMLSRNLPLPSMLIRTLWLDSSSRNTALVNCLMETIRDAQAVGDAPALVQARTQLRDLQFYLET